MKISISMPAVSPFLQNELHLSLGEMKMKGILLRFFSYQTFFLGKGSQTAPHDD